MLERSPSQVAEDLFHQNVTMSGFGHPQSCRELLEIIVDRGDSTELCEDAPPDFRGLQSGDAIFVAVTPLMTDFDKMRIIAHEWAHRLRRREDQLTHTAHFYTEDGATINSQQDFEEAIAQHFESML